jgi:hypothetical protein
MGLSRTALFVRRSVGGLFAVEDMGVSTGARLFVCSLTGTDAGGYGTGPDKPLATLAYAVALCTTLKGDIIYLMPGHAEAKTITGDLATLNVAGVTVIGLGRGDLIPTFTLGHAGTTITVSAASVTIKNIKIIADIADVAVGITATNAADGLVVEDCWFTDGGLTSELVIGIQIAAGCNNVVIRNNRFYTTISAETGGCASAIKLVGASSNTQIVGNFALGHYTVACVDAVTAAAASVLIRDNVFCNIDTGAGLGFSGHTQGQFVLAYNGWAGAKGNTEPVSGVTASFCLENYGIDALAANGILSPAAGAFS